MPKNRPVHLQGNWKMNHQRKELMEFLQELSNANLPSNSGLSTTIFAPALLLEAAQTTAKSLNLHLNFGSQNTHWMEKGAFTGEISTTQLQDIGVSKSLVGHSERRQFFGETIASTRLRCEHLLKSHFEVTFCVGETLQERNEGKTYSVLEEQLSGVLPHLEAISSGKLILAYEPVWAIGTGQTATPAQAQEVHAWIRAWILKSRGTEVAQRTPLLYGGSVQPQNLAELLNCPDIDGALVGGASLKAQSWIELCSIALARA